MTWQEATTSSFKGKAMRRTDDGLVVVRHYDGQTRVDLPDGTARHATPAERDGFLDWEPVW